jgi:alpha-glucosidase (family GH31 glycosyl hydrolase)
MPAQALAAVATLLSFAAQGDRVAFTLDHGSADLQWYSDSTFRFRRALDGPLDALPRPEHDAVAVKIEDTPGAVRIRSESIEVIVQKHGLLVSVLRSKGQPLMKDLSEPVVSGQGVAWDRESPAGERFYGLGPRPDGQFTIGPKAVAATIPFLISTAGYGEFHPGAGPWRFDFTGAGRYRIEAPRVDYFFYFGPPPKEIFREHSHAGQALPPWQYTAPAVSWAGLRDALLSMVQGAMSGAIYPSFDLAKFAAADPALLLRARQLGSLVSRVVPGAVGLSDFRTQLRSFFMVYGPEADYHGYPTWHPLPFQFPADPECALHGDEFMLGDEMLIAPITDASGKRSVYLPQGIWTNLETNQVQPGRTTVAVETASLPVFARNGTIIPLDAAGGMALHYFPTLGAEFFLLEQDIGEYSQVHAAPAADIMRLEIESKKARSYQWVVHHVDRPASVSFEQRVYREAASAGALVNGTWFYDAASRTLHIRVDVKAGEDNIINLGF